jgi:hypothetical protein
MLQQKQQVGQQTNVCVQEVSSSRATVYLQKETNSCPLFRVFALHRFILEVY